MPLITPPPSHRCANSMFACISNRDLGLHHVRSNLDKHPAVIHKIVACVLERIERERLVACTKAHQPFAHPPHVSRVDVDPLFSLQRTVARCTHQVVRMTRTDVRACVLARRCRRGELMDRSLLSSVCRMLVALGLYPQFEVAFMEHSELFYQAEGSRRAVDDEARARQRASGVC